jgi:hypothetical protein
VLLREYLLYRREQLVAPARAEVGTLENTS